MSGTGPLNPIVKCLPYRQQERWTEEVARLEMKGVPVTFTHLAEFIMTCGKQRKNQESLNIAVHERVPRGTDYPHQRSRDAGESRVRKWGGQTQRSDYGKRRGDQPRDTTYPDQDRRAGDRLGGTMYADRDLRSGDHQHITISHHIATTKQCPPPQQWVKDAPPSRGAKFCPRCDTHDHFLNNCSVIAEMTKDQKEVWLTSENCCLLCARCHTPNKCTLQQLCPICKGKHLMILHKVNPDH